MASPKNSRKDKAKETELSSRVGAQSLGDAVF